MQNGECVHKSAKLALATKLFVTVMTTLNQLEKDTRAARQKVRMVMVLEILTIFQSLWVSWMDGRVGIGGGGEGFCGGGQGGGVTRMKKKLPN